MKNFIYQFLVSVFFAATIFSCQNNSVYDEYRAIPLSGWDKDSVIVFHVPVTDTTKSYNLIIGVRNEIDYKFSNLWLFIEIVEPGGHVKRDTFEIALADPAGRWIGSGLAGIKNRDAIYRRNVKFSATGVYTIKIRHGMRERIIHGIHDLGFRVGNVTNH
jgi:gliding motility-associated lipoprotein GldH